MQHQQVSQTTLRPVKASRELFLVVDDLYSLGFRALARPTEINGRMSIAGLLHEVRKLGRLVLQRLLPRRESDRRLK